MRHTVLLFDIDGTLLNTGGAGVQAMRSVACRLFGDHFTFDGMTFSGGLDPAIFAEAARRNRLENHEDHHESFRDAYLRELRQALSRQGQATCLPGIREVLDTLRQRSGSGGDVVLGLLTGNYTRAVPLKLEAVGIDPEWFTLTAFGDEGRTRPDLVALALTRYQQQMGHPADPSRVVVIGDTPKDVECAKAHDCVAFAVATGRYSVAELGEAGADVVVSDLGDPGPLLRLVGEMETTGGAPD